MDDKIIQIDTLRIDRKKPRKCVCKVRKFTIDTVNREITCDCGLVVDPFEAMEYLATHYEQINREHRTLREQAEYWKKQKPYSVLFKRLEQSYSKGKMLPSCPHCNQLFDFKQLTYFHNAEFYRKLQAREKEAAYEGD